MVKEGRMISDHIIAITATVIILLSLIGCAHEDDTTTAIHHIQDLSEYGCDCNTTTSDGGSQISQDCFCGNVHISGEI